MLLKFLRKRKNMKRIMWALAILIIPAFVIWGAGSSSKKIEKGPDYAGKLFNRKVPFEEYIDMWNVTRDNLVRTFGGTNIPPEIIDQLSWNRIILLELAKRENIIVKNEEVVAQIVSYPMFQRDGNFDKKLYKSMLGDSAYAFEERVKDDLAISKLSENVTKAVSLTDEEVKEEYKKRDEKIKASYISVPFSDFEKEVRYQEDDIIKFYENNKETFRKPEEVNVKYIELLSSESDNKEDLAYKVLDEAVNKKNLDTLSRTFELEAKETGFFSVEQEIPGIGWAYEFARKSFELNEGDISNTLIKTDKGFYIIQLKEKKESYIPAFTEAKDSVISAYVKAQSMSLAEKKARKLSLKIKNNKRTLESLGLEVIQTEFINRDGYIPTLGPARDFVETGSSIKNGEIGGPVKMLGTWVILKLDEYQGIDEKKFSEEKEGFKQNLLAQKKEEAFNQWFVQMKKQANFVSYTLNPR